MYSPLEYDVETIPLKGMEKEIHRREVLFISNGGTLAEFKAGQLYGQVEGFMNAHLIHPLAGATILSIIDALPYDPFRIAEARAIYVELVAYAADIINSETAVKQ